MDHQEFAQLLGNYGEFFGAIAVGVTLVFLTVQLRQNTRMIRAQINQSLTHTAQVQNESVYNSPYLPDILAKLDQNEALSGAETIRYRLYVRNSLRVQDNLYWQYRQGLLEEHILRTLRTGARNLVGRSEHSRRVWESLRQSYSDEFASLVEEAISKG